MHMANRLIVHSLIENNGQYLLIKRSEIKRDKKNFYPAYWDIPGGTVEDGELPRQAAIRECQEEVGLKITIDQIIHEDSNVDKDKVFTRLVYRGQLLENSEDLVITLDPQEHTDYRWVTSLAALPCEKIVPYLYAVLGEAVDGEESSLH